MPVYESHSFVREDFPLIIHRDEISPQHSAFIPHWHENVELLCFLSGSCTLLCDAEQFPMRAGELAVINVNRLHAAYTDGSVCRYYCLIPSSAFLEKIGLPVGKLTFAQKLDASAFLPLFERLFEENQRGDVHFKPLCTGLCVQLMSSLAREHARIAPAPSPSRMERVKVGLGFLRESFRESVSVDEVAAAAGLSKYYFCRLFREYTGMSVIDYLNRLRCEEARRLLTSGRYNVSQSAQLAGFNNLSYFTKTYQLKMGCLPSREG